MTVFPSDRPLRIAIDGYNFAMSKGTGVATYGLSLARMLQDMGHHVEGIFGIDVGKAPDMREALLYDAIGRERKETRKQIRRRVRHEKFSAFWKPKLNEVNVSEQIERQALADRMPMFNRLWSATHLFEAAHWHFRLFGRFLNISVANPPDIMHWTYPLPIYLKGAKNIYTLHDLVPLRMPFATLDDKQFYYRLVAECIARGDRICTVSETSKEDIMERFPAPDGHIVNTYQSSPVPKEVLASDPTSDAALIERLFGLSNKGYFLFFGALDPKKNISRIVEAYLSSNAQSPLVLVSARDWGMSEKKKNNSHGMEMYGQILADDRIIQLDYMPRALLFRLIRTAKAVLFPSLFEGFGLPALEAIQLGTTVIGSKTGSLPEVIGEAGLLVDPYNVADIMSAIQKLDQDEGLRSRLVASGPAQAEKFSDDRYKSRLHSLYESTLARQI